MTCIHFAHANGFPAKSYRQLFTALPDDWQILAIEKFGHHPNYPVSVNWELQVTHLCEYITQYAPGPVYGVGHSFGAVLTYMAACKYPELFRGIILMDPPLVTGVTRHLARLLKGTRWFDRLSPAHKAVNRCSSWSADTDLVGYFKSRTLFQNFNVRCIEDYVSAATEVQRTTRRLTFSPAVEAEIFRQVPLNIPKYFGQLSVQGLLLTGEQSRVCRNRNIRSFVKHNQLEHQILAQGGHMFPLEQPENTARIITRKVASWAR